MSAQTTGHTHEAQHVQRHKCDEEADDPEPECAFTPGFVQGETKGFRPPVGQACEATEYHAANDDVMEVRNQEQTVVQYEVRTRYCQQNTGHPTNGEGNDEADSPHHRRVEDDAAPYMVNSQLKILTPVGIAIIIVVIPKKAFTFAPAPMVKKWCSQTMNDRTVIQTVAHTSEV